MSDIELQALIALVNNQTARINGEVARYGQLMWNPRTPEVEALEAETNRRLVASSPDASGIGGGE